MTSIRLTKSFVVLLALLTSMVVQTSPASSATGSSNGFSFRAVLCFAPELSTKSAFPSAAALPVCTSAYRLTAKNLGVVQSNSATGFTMKTVQPDPRFLHFRSTLNAKILLTSDILISGIKGESGRFVLGRAQLTRSSFKSARAEKQHTGRWVVVYRLTSAGSVAWDAFAKRQFHAMIAVVANGEVYSAPLIQPNQTRYTSFGGAGEISGNFTRTEALDLAKLM